MHDRQGLHTGEIAAEFCCIHTRNDFAATAYQFIALLLYDVIDFDKTERFCWRILKRIERVKARVKS